MKSRTTNPEAAPRLLGRRDVLKAAAASGAAIAAGSIGLPAMAAPLPDGDRGRRSRQSCTGGLILEGIMPRTPLVLAPFTVPLANPFLAPASPATAAEIAGGLNPNPPSPGVGLQDSLGHTHQAWPGNVSSAIPTLDRMPQPILYKATMRLGQHSYVGGPTRTLVPHRNTSGSLIPAGTVIPRLAPTTIYGFNGGFYGAMTIFAEYGKPLVFRIENRMDLNPRNLDRGDYGSPARGFLTHLHNGHTAAESDGNPHHNIHGYLPGDWVDNLYLNYPAGNDDSQKMSFLWFHDHFEGHTGANVYKGMAGLYPVWDSGLDLDGNRTSPSDHADENDPESFRLPGVRIDRGSQQWGVDYDVPLVCHDVALDDGNTPHSDWHNGCGEVQPYNFGRGFFRHLPDQGFVGDLFCVNGTAFPVLHVKRRKYRFRFLNACISRQFEVAFMRSATNQLTAAVDMLPLPTDPVLLAGHLQGQYRLLDGQVGLRMLEIANGGGLLPEAVPRTSMEFWPAMRPQVIIDFTQDLNGNPTQKGDVFWLVNIMRMPTGRKPDAGTREGIDPQYKIPMMKIVIGDDAPDGSAPWWSPNWQGSRPPLRPQLPLPDLTGLTRRDFRLERGSGGGSNPEIQWLISLNGGNALPFDHENPMVTVTQRPPTGTPGEIWSFRTSGGWDHPMHIHQEEFRIISRTNPMVPNDDAGKDDVMELKGGETIVTYRNFRSFTGEYVAHCHQLAHEDHAMMFAWTIAPPPPGSG
jgi:FtsP/CotA-like multicopper oxidase with cupredoxin domain